MTLQKAIDRQYHSLEQSLPHLRVRLEPGWRDLVVLRQEPTLFPRTIGAKPTAQCAVSGPSAGIRRLFADMNRIISVAGTFDLDSGETNLPETISPRSWTRWRRSSACACGVVEAALAKPRMERPEDPLAGTLRALLGTSSLETVQQTLGGPRRTMPPRACSMPSGPFACEMRSPIWTSRGSSRTAASWQGHYRPSMRPWTSRAPWMGTASIFGSRDRIAMPDEPLRFGPGPTETRRCSCTFWPNTCPPPGRAMRGGDTVRLEKRRLFVRLNGAYVVAGSGERLPAPSEPIVIELA